MKKRLTSDAGYLEIEITKEYVSVATGMLGGGESNIDYTPGIWRAPLDLHNNNSEDSIKYYPVEAAAAMDETVASMMREGYKLTIIPDLTDDEEKNIEELKSKIVWNHSEMVAGFVKELLRTDIDGYARDFVLAVGIKLGEDLDDEELKELKEDLIFERDPESINSVDLAFRLAAVSAADAFDDEAIAFARRALELGSSTASFFDDESFEPLYDDEEFERAIRVERPSDHVYYHMEHVGFKRISPSAEAGCPNFMLGRHIEQTELPDELVFEIDTRGEGPGHFIQGKDVLAVDLKVMKLLSEAGLDDLESFFPATLWEGDSKWEDYCILNTLRLRNVLDNELSERHDSFTKWDYKTMVLHGKKLRSKDILFRPVDNPSALICRDDVYELFLNNPIPGKWGIQFTELEVSCRASKGILTLTSVEDAAKKVDELLQNERIDEAAGYANALMENHSEDARSWIAGGRVCEEYAGSILYSNDAASRFQDILDFCLESISYYERAVEIDPSYGRAWRGIGRVSLLRAPHSADPDGEKRPVCEEKGLPSFFKAAEHEKTDINYRLLYQQLEKAGDSYSGSIAEVVDEWVENVPDSFMAYGIRADIFAENGDKDKALEYYERSLSLRSTAKVLYALAGIHFERNDLEKAKEYIESIGDRDCGYGFFSLDGYHMRPFKKDIRDAYRLANNPEGKPDYLLSLGEREGDLWYTAEHPYEGVVDLITVNARQVREAIDSLDNEKITASFNKQLKDILAKIDDPAQYEALVIHNAKKGYAVKEVDFDEAEGGNDLGDPDRYIPMHADLDDLPKFDCGAIMDIWEKRLLSRMRESRIPMVNDNWVEYCDLMQAFEHIFQQKTFILAATAYDMIDGPKPDRLFLGITDRSPRMIFPTGDGYDDVAYRRRADEDEHEDDEDDDNYVD
ncbi:MAG: tetratricopeptide repeat protein [Candidatus Methanoplasma sp.]|nr:tetratricopeptide repeat protein [Candidatus Methanoplasma sp.]